MKTTPPCANLDRRQFMAAILPACALSGFTLKNVIASEQEIHKFQKDFVHTYEEAFRWRFHYYINFMEQFAKVLGRNKLIDMIQQANDDYYTSVAENDPDFSFDKWLEGGSVYANMMTSTVVEKTDKIYEIHVTECLWTKTFKERNAADIGYATVCYSDFGSARATHPKLSLERSKSLMQGHDCCNHRWTFEG